LGGTCVVKCVPAEDSTAPSLSAEGALLADLAHPNLVEIVTRFTNTQVSWSTLRQTGFATRWVDGQPMVAGLEGSSRETALRSFAMLVDTVDYLHRRGILHLDIKPDNALWTGERTVLLDLGSARPLDAGPGEAGGTLGYAAPEVLAGQAASPVADVYSMGVILYELLARDDPYGGLTAGRLRRAVMHGEVIPVRAMCPDVPHFLAALLDRMLCVEPAGRPVELEEIRATVLKGIEAETPPAGMPPCVGRAREAAALHALLDKPAAAEVWVVGDPGSGRSRLVRRVLDDRLERPDREALDLSMVADPVRALDSYLASQGVELPDQQHRSAWKRSVVKAVSGLGKNKTCTFFFGRREARSPDGVRLLDELSGALIGAGFNLLWASVDTPAGGAAVELRPLDDRELTELLGFYGISHRSRARELRVRTGGWPGAVVSALAPVRSAVPSLHGPAGRMAAALRVLPLGLPEAIVGRLPADLSEGLALLREQDAVQLSADGRLYLDQGASDEPLDPATRAALESLIVGEPPEEDPLWIGLAAARLGLWALATERFEAGIRQSGGRRSLMVELADALAARGHRQARSMLAKLRAEDADLDGAIELLRGLEGRTEEEALRLVRILGRARRFDEAIEEARRLQADQPSPELLLLIAGIHLKQGDLVSAEDACDKAERVTGGSNDAILTVRVRVALQRVLRGSPSPGVDDLLVRLEERTRLGQLDLVALSAGGRLLIALGQLERGALMLEQAAGLEEAKADPIDWAGIRLNCGNAWQKLGKGRKARKCYREALLSANRAGKPELMVRIRYALAELELRWNRLPAAETQIAAFLAEVARVDIPEAEARGAELRARFSLAQDRPQAALDALTAVSLGGLSPELVVSIQLRRAQAQLELGRPDDVLTMLAEAPRSREPTIQALVGTLRARAHFAMGRRLMTEARKAVPPSPDPMIRLEAGQILLGTAGEDLDPASFQQRREDLDRAARLLRGESAARAATLRDRLLDGPGAALEGIVALTETMHDPKAFPEAMARLVAEALGAHRVLIMVRIPGLGQQVTYTELSGAEAAGIGMEVLRRIQSPSDYWTSNNAFADPHLRKTSHTVRTFELKSLLAVAIPHGGKAVGALYVDDVHRANRFGDEDVAVLRRLAGAIGQALPLLSSTSQERLLDEPAEIMGVLLSKRDQVADIQYSLSMLKGQSQTNLLVTGPTGAGKSVFSRRLARELYGLTGVETVVLRKGDPNMLVTQLVGARKGDYTGATEREGAIQRCLRQQRALFLDEVQNLDDAGQQILLPLLELPERHIAGLTSSSERLNRPLHVILGTNVGVSHGGWSQHFREDLWYRMSHVHVHLPPLVERGPEAVYRYLATMLTEEGVGAPERVFETAALHRATNWDWPGNLRRLSAFAQRAAHLHRTREQPVALEDLARLGLDPIGEASQPDGVGVEEAMLEFVLDTLKRMNWVQKAAAAELKWSPSRLNKYLSRHGLIDEVQRNRKALRSHSSAG